MNLKMTVSKITIAGNNYSAYDGDLMNKNHGQNPIKTKKKLCTKASLVVFLFSV